jgi:hypothetical protein
MCLSRCSIGGQDVAITPPPEEEISKIAADYGLTLAEQDVACDCITAALAA